MLSAGSRSKGHQDLARLTRYSPPRAEQLKTKAQSLSNWQLMINSMSFSYEVYMSTKQLLKAVSVSKGAVQRNDP